MWRCGAGVVSRGHIHLRRCASQRLDPTATVKKTPPPAAAASSAIEEESDVETRSVMLRSRLKEMWHKTRRVLTTSERTHWNQTDIIDSKQYARAHRRRVQRMNDLFHSAGKRGQIFSYEAVMLQFQGVEWSYMIIPAALALLVVILIAVVDGRPHRAKLEEEMKAFGQRADYLASVRKESEEQDWPL